GNVSKKAPLTTSVVSGAVSGRRDLNPRPLAPQAQFASSLLVRNTGFLGHFYTFPAGSKCTQVKHSPQRNAARVGSAEHFRATNGASFGSLPPSAVQANYRNPSRAVFAERHL